MECIIKSLSSLRINDNGLIKLQNRIKTFLFFKKQINDEYFNKNLLDSYLDNYINQQELICDLNNSLSNKKIRRTNFPSEISENIVKYTLFRKYKIMPKWDIKKGDLIIGHQKVEVKCFSSNGPISFGPSEEWDWIIFVDARFYKDKKFKIYLLKHSNTSNIWSNLKINKKETILDQYKQKRRPRLSFEEIYKQLEKHITIVFDDHLNILF